MLGRAFWVGLEFGWLTKFWIYSSDVILRCVLGVTKT